MKTIIVTIVLLVISNVFMTFAWYGHLKMQQTGFSANWPLYVVILVSWGIALVEYFFMIPANRIGFEGNGGPFTLMQLKVLQEAITLVGLTLIAMFMFNGQHFRWNHLLAFLFLIAAVYLVFLPQEG